MHRKQCVTPTHTHTQHHNVQAKRQKPPHSASVLPEGQTHLSDSLVLDSYSSLFLGLGIPPMGPFGARELMGQRDWVLGAMFSSSRRDVEPNLSVLHQGWSFYRNMTRETDETKKSWCPGSEGPEAVWEGDACWTHIPSTFFNLLNSRVTLG